MSISTTVTYDNPAAFTYDNTKIEVTTDADLKKLPLQTDEIMVASAIDGKDADRFTTSGTGTLTGSLVTVGGEQYIECSAVNEKWEFVASESLPNQIGCWRGKIIPLYSGSPASNRFIFWDGTDGTANDSFYLYHTTSGDLLSRAYAGGTFFLNFNWGNWVPVAGQEYEFEMNYDFTTGASRLFIDGVQTSGGTAPSIGTRGNSNLMRMGSGFDSPTSQGDFQYRDLQVFGATQHTGDFAGEIPRNVPIYPLDTPTIEPSSPTYMSQLTSFTEVSTLAAGSAIQYVTCIAGVCYYHDGASWVVSNETYAQTNTPAEINTNVAGLDSLLSGGKSVVFKAYLSSATGRKDLPTLTAINYDHLFYNPADTLYKCRVYGEVRDNSDNPIEGALVEVDGTDYYYLDGVQSDVLVGPKNSVETDADGKWEMDVIQTATSGTTVNFVTSYEDEDGIPRRRLDSGKTIPKEPEKKLSEL